MKIIKLIHQIYPKNSYPKEHYSIIFDNIPEMKYEQIGDNFIGSALDCEGNVIFSNVLKKESFKGAFGGRELCLSMQNGTQKIIKDYWYDCGAYSKHGAFVDIGASTLTELQDCFVFCGMSINKESLQKMIADYLKFDKTYTYKELREWVRLQYEWFPVYIGKDKLPLMVNKNGDFVTVNTKEPVYPRTNYLKTIRGTSFSLCYFNYSYHNGDRLIKHTNTMLQVLKDSLPYTEDEIILNARLPI